MFIRVGEVTVQQPEGPPVVMKSIQALDPVFEMPVAQILVPKGEMAIKLGDALADRNAGDKLVVPDFIAPEDLRPGEG